MTDSQPEPSPSPEPTTPATAPVPPAYAPTDPAATARATRRRTLLTGLAGAAIGAALVGATWAITAYEGTPDTFTLTGTFVLTDSGVFEYEGKCRGTGGYDDIAPGTSVTVYDAKGETVSVGELGKSVHIPGACSYKVSVPDVPKGSDFYKIEVSHRGTVQLSAKDAEAGKFGGHLG